jgi:hypothetical protein
MVLGFLVMGMGVEGLLWDRILANRDGIRATQKLGQILYMARDRMGWDGMDGMLMVWKGEG